MKYVLNIDWLQIHCEGVINRACNYKFEKKEYSTQVFECIEEVSLNHKLIATVCSVPRSKILSYNMVIIKFSNEVLYNPNLYHIVKTLVSNLSLSYIGLTRLDVCADFNYFTNGLYPETLIKKFMSNQIRKLGQSKGSCHFNQKTDLIFDTLRFGTGKSIISAYLYNKTKELNEVKMKPYIVDCWRASGLDVDKTVWRLEFTIKGNQMSLLNKKTAELVKLDIQSIFDKTFLMDLYSSLQQSYFRFKVISADKNVSRWRDVILFDNTLHDWDRLFEFSAGDSSRSDKIFLKKLEMMNTELRNYANYRNEFLTELTAEFATSKGLQDYYLERINGKATNVIKYLKKEQFTMYEAMSRVGKIAEKSETLFTGDELNESICKVVLSPKKAFG